MKKLIAALAALTLIAGALPFEGGFVSDYSITANAEEEPTKVIESSLTFNVYSDHAEVYRCDQLSKREIIVPAEVNGVPVTGIGRGSFAECSSLTSVTIPDSVTSIGDGALSGCSSLESVTILNPDCDIYDISSTICNSSGNGSDENGNPYFNGTIYGYEGSTAQAYAEKYGYTFKALDGEPTAIVYGDANCEGEVKLNDAVLIMQAISNPNKFGIDGTDELHITEDGWKNADCSGDGDGVSGKDALAIQKLTLQLIDTLPEK